MYVLHGISFEEPNPTGSRPRDLIGLYRQRVSKDLEATQKGAGSRIKGGMFSDFKIMRENASVPKS